VKNEAVLIREVFPKGDSCTRVDRKLTVASTSGTEVKELNKIVANVYTSVNVAQKFNDCKFSLKVRELFEENNTLYIVNDFSPSSLLISDVLRGGNRILPEDAKRLVGELIVALAQIHNEGAVHGNIRPESIVMNGDQVLLTGYHYGVFACVDYSSEHMISRSNHYAPIEQVMNNKVIGPQADIYSLGAVWYALLTGKLLAPAIVRISPDTVSEIGLDASDLSPAEAEIIQKMTAVNARDRYADVYELVEALKSAGIMNIKLPALKKKAAVSGAEGAKVKKSSGGKKGLVVAIIAILVCAVVALSLYAFVFNTDDETNSVDPATDMTESATEDSDGTDVIDGKPNASGSWKDNVLMPSKKDRSNNNVFGNAQYNRQNITSVEFCSTLENAGADAWDVSASKDKSVMAWVSGTKLFIGAEGGINASGTATAAMFDNYLKLGEIKFGDVFYTEEATDMSSMFENCVSLKTINFPESFDTSSVKSMSSMFDTCRGLTSLNLRMFNTSRVEDMSNMFLGCSSLPRLDLKNFNTQVVMKMSKMFNGCSGLDYLDISGFEVKQVTIIENMFGGCVKLNTQNTKINDEKIMNELNNSKDKGDNDGEGIDVDELQDMMERMKNQD